jgi:hypothetical protein
MASRRRLEERFAFASKAVHHHRRRPVLEVLEGRVVLSTFTVNSLGDAGTGSNDAGDLRYCINQANADDQANTIVFDLTVFGTPQTITLSGGQLELSDTGGTQTITGPTAGVTISGGGGSRVFQVDSSVAASISGLTITGGNGGGLANYGTATLTDCTFSGNFASNGGGVNNSGTATLIGCTVSDNTAYYRTYSGYSYYGGRSYITGGNGGGMDNSGTATLTGCTLSGNSASLGAGVFNGGTATLTNCTIAGNSAGTSGGGIEAQGTVTVTCSTFARNQATYGGAIDNNFGRYTVTVGDSILAGDSAGTGPEFCNSVTSTGHNLVAETDGGSGWVSSDLTGTAAQPLNALLAVLDYYGGPTQTMALLAGSPALGAGVIADYPGTTTPITTDQRGLPLDSPNPDIGAFQTQGSPLLGLTFSVNDQSITYGAPSVTFSGTLADGAQAPVGETVAVTLDGVEQSATIGPGGAFSTTFDTTGLTVPDSPYTVDYAYAYTSGASFASASATSMLTVNPTLITLTVDSLGDAGIGSGDAGDLRYCIDQANSDDQSNTIVFDPTVFGTAQTITLSGGTFELENIWGTQTITGPAAGLTISGDGNGRVFLVDGGVTASISGLTITGGGVENYGTATLNDCTVSGNVFATIGSAPSVSGGGVDNTGTATLTDCTVSGNTTACDGGGVNNYGTATLTGCTLSGNYGYFSGGVFNSGSAELTMSDTIVAGNTNASGASDIESVGNFSGSYNLIGTGGSGGLVNGVDGNIVGVANPLLSQLGNYGGPTQTMALLAGSPALGAGVIADYPGTTTSITTDQRGLPLDSPNPDIGAFQTQGSPLLGLTFSVSDQSITYGTPSVTISGTLADGAQAPVGETVAVTLDGVEQSATIGPGGAFSTTLDTADLTVPDSPYTIIYAYTTDGTFASESTTSKLTVNPILITLTVDSLGDAGIGSGDAGDLRYCIDQANSDGQSNAIVFDPTVFSTPQTITLSGGELELENIWGTQTITGPAAGLTISGGGSSRVFQVDPGVSASITGLTISGGYAYSLGGGLFNQGTATLTDCTLSGNSAFYGGGMFNDGTANISDCTLSGNISDGLTNIGSATLIGCTITGNDRGVVNARTPYQDTADLVLINCTINGNYGEGVANSALLSLTNCTISGNTGYSGGGLDNYGGLATLTGCTITGNYGGGVSNTANLAMSDCTLSANSALDGGGLDNGGSATLTDCTLSGNVATPDGGDSSGVGGAVFNGQSAQSEYGYGYTYGSADLSLTDCTLSGNSAESGGGVYNSGSSNLIACTVSGNSGGGLVNTSGAMSLTDTIVAGNTNSSGASDIGGRPLVTGGNNLIGTGGSGGLVNGVDGNIVGVANPLLAPLGNNGGPTQTMALLDGSPAIGGGIAVTGVTADQRGEPLDFPNPDIGAFQTQGFQLLELTFSVSNQNITYGTSSVTVSGTLADGSQAPAGETVAVTLDRVEQSATIGTGGGFSTTFDTTGLSVADSPDTIAYAYTSDGTFASASTTSTLTVNPATLTITADPETKAYGATDPALAYTASGFQFSDTAATVLTGALARAQAGTLAGEQTGGYAISQGTLAANRNYTISFTGNTLTITPAPLTVTADPQSKVYGTADPALTDEPAGLVDQTVDGVTIDDTAATVLTGALAPAQSGTLAGEQVGDYAISQGTLAAGSNYSIAFTGSTLTITPAPLTVTASPQTKIYGTNDPTLTDTATGFVMTTVDGVAIDDTAASVLTGHLTRAPGETVAGGPYPITQGTLAASNYTIHFTGNALTIAPAKLTIVAEPKTKVFGSADPTLAYTASGFQSSDTAATVLTGSLARAVGETVAGGPYAIGQGTLTADGNYTIHFTGSSLSITSATPAVIVSDPGGTYTGAPIAAMATVTGVGGTATPDLEGVTPTLTYYAGTGTSGTDLDSAAPSAAGTYTVVARFPGSADYLAADSEPATFAIAPVAATIALTSSTSSPVYGQAVTFVATVSSPGAPVGTVTFSDGTTLLATVPLDGSGQTALTISTLSLGSHAITATYNGGTDFLGVTSGTAAESVSQSATAIVLVPQVVLEGKKMVGLTAEIGPVVPGGVVPTGQVTFEFVTKHRKKVTVKTLGTAELSGGKATLTVKLNQVLKKPLTIVYSGDPDFLASTMSLPKLTKTRNASSRI